MNTFFWIIITIFLGLLYTLFNTLSYFSSFWTEISWILFLFSCGFSIAQFLSYFLTDIIFSKLKGKASNDLLKFIVSILLYTLCMTVILKFVLGWDLTALLTTSALLTAVIGFALQATLGNLFAGVAIQIEQPFNIGDVININDNYGRVETLRWRSMTLRTFDGTRLVIPNSQISTKIIEVFPENKPVRITLRVPAPINVSPEFICKIIHKVIVATPDVFTDIKPFINIDEYDTLSGIIWYEIKYFITNYKLEHIIDALVKNRLWYAFQRHRLNMNRISHPKNFDIQITNQKKYPEISKKDIANCVSKLFKHCSQQELDQIVDSVIVYTYASGEPIFYTESVYDATVYIYNGIVKIQKEDDHILKKPFKESENFYDYWPSDVLQKANEHLTRYVGPISEKLIHKAASSTLDEKLLYNQLSLNIEDDNNRKKFLSYAPEISYKFLLKNSSFSLSNMSNTKAFSQGETTLLLIQPVTNDK